MKLAPVYYKSARLTRQEWQKPSRISQTSRTKFGGRHGNYDDGELIRIRQILKMQQWTWTDKVIEKATINISNHCIMWRERHKQRKLFHVSHTWTSFLNVSKLALINKWSNGETWKLVQINILYTSAHNECHLKRNNDETQKPKEK